MHTNHGDLDPSQHRVVDSENPGYETTDVNVNGVVVFLVGLAGFLLIFFVFCFGMGKVINSALEKQDGPSDKWHPTSSFEGAATTNGKRQDLASNPEMQQKELHQMTASFPTPRLDIDDGNQATADMHAKEDLLLNHYSSSGALSSTGLSSTNRGAAIRIPIDRAMELIAQRGLPVMTEPTASATEMAGDNKPQIQAPLTTGFARTAYELDVMEARRQKMNYGKAEGTTQAQLTPIR